MLTQHNRDDVATEQLGIDTSRCPHRGQRASRRQRQPRLGDCPGVVLGSLEARAGKDAWRNPAPVRDPSALLTQRGWVPGRYVTTLVPEHSERSGHSPAKSGHDCSANEISQEPVEVARIFQGKKMRSALAGFEYPKVCPRDRVSDPLRASPGHDAGAAGDDQRGQCDVCTGRRQSCWAWLYSSAAA